jgi:hypothetical protein
MDKLTPKNRFLLTTFALLMAAVGFMGLYSNGAVLCGGKASGFSCSSYSGVRADLLSLLFIGAAVWAVARMLQLKGHGKARQGVIGLYGIGAAAYLAVKAF